MNEFENEKRAKLQATAFIAELGMLMKFKAFAEETSGYTSQDYLVMIQDALAKMLLCS